MRIKDKRALIDMTALKNICTEILQKGIDRYSRPMLLGIVSRIENNDYEIFSVLSHLNVIKEDEIYRLDGVYCRDVFKTKETIAITEIDNIPGMKLHPLYDGFPIEVYISSPIIVDSQVWGTINYSSIEISETPFSEEDIQFNESCADEIASVISKL